MEIVWFTLVAVGLYLLSDRVLDWIERRRGARFKNRSLIFFGFLLSSALATFWLIRFLSAAPA